MAKKKTRSCTVEYEESMENVPDGDQTLTAPEQPVEPDVHEVEEVVVVDIPPTTPDTSVDEEKPALGPHNPITSYVKTQRSSDPNVFANNHF
jgi:hypothetical protein